MNQAYIAEDVREDFEAGLEYAVAAAILRMVQRGDERQYLVRCGGCDHVCVHRLASKMSSGGACHVAHGAAQQPAAVPGQVWQCAQVT